MVVNRNPWKRGLRLTLGTGADTNHVLGRIVPDVTVSYLHARRDPQISEPVGNLRVLDHSPADERDPPVELKRQIQHDLHPVQAGGEHRHHDTPLGAGEDLLEPVDDVAFGTADPFPLNVRAVAEQHQHPFGAELRETMKVHMLAVERGLIELEIPSVQHDSGRRGDGNRDAVGHAVRNAQELDRETPYLHPIARTHGRQACARVFVFGELRLDERERQRRPINRSIDVRQHVCDRADVILVAVRQNQRLNLVLLERTQVRDDQVDPEELWLGKHHARVDQDGGLAAGDHHHVHAELAQPPERDQLERRRFGDTRRFRTVTQMNEVPVKRN